MIAIKQERDQLGESTVCCTQSVPSFAYSTDQAQITEIKLLKEKQQQIIRQIFHSLHASPRVFYSPVDRRCPQSSDSTAEMVQRSILLYTTTLQQQQFKTEVRPCLSVSTGSCLPISFTLSAENLYSSNNNNNNSHNPLFIPRMNKYIRRIRIVLPILLFLILFIQSLCLAEEENDNLPRECYYLSWDIPSYTGFQVSSKQTILLVYVIQ